MLCGAADLAEHGHRLPFKSVPIDDIRRSDIVSLLDAIEEESGPVMADRTLATVRRIMNWHASRSDEFRSPIVRGMAQFSSKWVRARRLRRGRSSWLSAQAGGEYQTGGQRAPRCYFDA